MSLMNTVKDALGVDPTQNADPDMARVLHALAAREPKPIEDCTPQEAREQPTPADAVADVMQAESLSADIPGVATEDITIAGAAGPQAARVYRPAGTGPLPVILYFHGGGWVIADIDVYDATPRAMAALTGAIVISAEYRRAPEHPFPAAHDDANAAYQWVLAHAASLGGDPTRIALLGESAGGNLAINVAIHARDAGLPAPVHQALIYPVASNDMHAESYHQNSNAKPLNKDMMKWFVKHVIRSDADKDDPRINVVAADLHNLPPTTVVTAGIDPLRSDGDKLTAKLTAAGVPTQQFDYPGATHEFFGMAAVVKAAKDAQQTVASGLKAAF